ncbi:MAG: WXG100 family type VII secretion target [Nocardioidaceae bacterium]|jgi:uncharacterized protein YukE
MAGAVGAELSTLSNLKRTFDQTAQQALDIRTAVDSGVDSAVWTGAYSDQFRSAWQEYRRNLETLHQALVQASDDVRSNHNNIAAATGENVTI